ncbi:MAG: insulinase family protein [Bacteroidetes bacterium]|nr:insulinase family protein [Bacteroidota bacterium]
MKHPYRLVLAPLFVALLFTGSAQAQIPGLDEVPPIDPAVRTGTFENGLTYYIRANSRPENRAELRLVVNAGSVLEDDDQRGLAHLLEHMAFNGTEHFKKQELVEYLESIGMRFGPNVNAFTSFDETVYILRVPMDDPEVVETGFQILEDWAHLISLEPEEIDLERGVVIEEWRLGRGADARMRDKQFPILFRGSRYAERLPVGTFESLQGFEIGRVRDFYQKWYRPDLMAVIAVGDFDEDVIEDMIRRHFASIPAAEYPAPREVFPVPNHDETLFAIASDPEATNSQIALYHKQPLRNPTTVGAYRQQVIVEGLYNSMLNNRLNELAQSADPPFAFSVSGQGQFVRSGEVYFLAAFVPDGGIEKGLNAILTEAERVARFGFTESEFDRQKVETLRNFERAYAERDKRESRQLAAEYRRNFLTDEIIPGIEMEWEMHQQFVPTVTLDEVNRLAREWITEHDRVVMVNSPEKAGLETPTEASLMAVFEAIESAEITPYEDATVDAPLMAEMPTPTAVIREETIEELGLTIWELGNGVRVLLRPTDFKDDEIRFRAFSPGGTSLVSNARYVPAMTASMIIGQSGVGEFNNIDLKKKLAGKVVSVSPSIGTYTEGLSGQASPKDVETLFQLINLQFTAPRHDSTAFIAYRTRMESFISNNSASPRRTFQDTINVTMSQGHYRARPFNMGVLDETNLEDSFAFYRERFADASDFTFVFVGNIDVDALRPLVETYIGGLPSIDREEMWADIGVEPPVGVIKKEILKGVEPQSQTTLIFTGEIEDTRDNRYIISSMAELLQIRLRERLREDLGGTYSVRVFGRIRREPDHGYSVSVSFGSAPDRVEELTDVVFQQIDSLSTVGPDSTERNKVQELQRRSYETNMRENRYWLNQLLSSEQYGSDPRRILDYEEMVSGLTEERIREAARTFFNMENYVKVSLFPETVTQ